MDEHVRAAALQIMRELAQHPVCNDFSEPFQPGEGEHNYFEVIRDPQDLRTITDRLERGEYKTVQAWARDVETVWANAETFHGNKSTTTVLAREGRRLFEKYCVRANIMSMGKWCREVYKLKSRIYEIMGQPPPRMKQFATNSTTAHAVKQAMPPMSEADLQNLVQASEMLVNEEEQNGMVQVIEENQPETDWEETETVLDVTKLALPTLYALREYLKTTLEKRNAKYPE